MYKLYEKWQNWDEKTLEDSRIYVVTNKKFYTVTRTAIINNRITVFTGRLREISKFRIDVRRNKDTRSDLRGKQQHQRSSYSSVFRVFLKRLPSGDAYPNLPVIRLRNPFALFLFIDACVVRAYAGVVERRITIRTIQETRHYLFTPI